MKKRFLVRPHRPLKLTVKVLSSANAARQHLDRSRQGVLQDWIDEGLYAPHQGLRLRSSLRQELLEQAERVLDWGVPGWRQPGWDAGWRADLGEMDRLWSVFKAFHTRRFTRIRVLVYPTGTDDVDAMRLHGVYAGASPPGFQGMYQVLLRVVPGKEDRALPTLVHELGHHLRGVWRPDCYDKLDELERSFQEGLCEALVKAVSGTQHCITRDALSDAERTRLLEGLREEARHQWLIQGPPLLSDESGWHTHRGVAPRSTIQDLLRRDELQYRLGDAVVRQMLATPRFELEAFIKAADYPNGGDPSQSPSPGHSLAELFRMDTASFVLHAFRYLKDTP